MGLLIYEPLEFNDVTLPNLSYICRYFYSWVKIIVDRVVGSGVGSYVGGEF